MKCYKCNANVKEGALFCTQCGTKLPLINENNHTENKKSFSECPRCNATVKDGAMFCTQCGTKLDDCTNENIKTNDNNIQDEKHSPIVLENEKQNNDVVNSSNLKDETCSDCKVKKNKVLFWIITAVITMGLLIVLVNTYKTSEHNENVESSIINEKQLNEENKAKIIARIEKIFEDVTLHNNTEEKYLSKSLRELMDKAYSLADGPGYLEADIWTETQDWDTVTANILDCSFANKTFASVHIEVINTRSNDNCYSLGVRRLDFIFEKGDWFVDNIISEAYNGSFKKYTKDFIYDIEGYQEQKHENTFSNSGNNNTSNVHKQKYLDIEFRIKQDVLNYLNDFDFVSKNGDVIHFDDANLYYNNRILSTSIDIVEFRRNSALIHATGPYGRSKYMIGLEEYSHFIYDTNDGTIYEEKAKSFR